MSLLFKPRHIPLIREGTKTATRRDWADSYARPTVGSVQIAAYDRPDLDKSPMFTSEAEADCFIRILEVYEEPLGAMTPADAAKEGGYSLEDFRAAWREINGEFDPEQVVDVVEFEYVGESRPTDQTTLQEVSEA